MDNPVSNKLYKYVVYEYRNFIYYRSDLEVIECPEERMLKYMEKTLI